MPKAFCGVADDVKKAVEKAAKEGKKAAMLTIKGEATEPFPEPEFFQTLMRIWLGHKPADWQLKDALLGKPVGNP